MPRQVELRSRHIEAGSTGTPPDQGARIQGRPSLGYLSWPRKKSDQPPGCPRLRRFSECSSRDTLVEHRLSNALLYRTWSLLRTETLARAKERFTQCTLREAATLKRYFTFWPRDENLPQLGDMHCALLRAVFDIVDHEWTERRCWCGIVERQAEKHDAMKRQSDRQNTELKPSTFALYPFDDVINIENKITFPITGLNDSEPVHVIVMPRHFVKLRVCPNLWCHFL